MITQVAIRLQRGTTYSMDKPNRHWNVLQEANKRESCKDVADAEQGFMNSNREFLTRAEAYLEAKDCNQIKTRKFHQYNGPDLYSEDLW